MNFIIENWDAFLTVLAAMHGLAVAIVNLTPTPKDDEIIAKIYKVVEVLAGILTDRAKDK
jgi:hypothetical protein